MDAHQIWSCGSAAQQGGLKNKEQQWRCTIDIDYVVQCSARGDSNVHQMEGGNKKTINQ